MSTFKYFVEPNAKDSHQTSTYWLALVTRFAVRNTVDHDKLRTIDLSKMSISSDRARGNPVEEAEPLLLSDEVATWSVQTNKNSPQGSATFTLQPMAITDMKGKKLGYDWRRYILGGDWLLFWAFDNREDYLRVKEQLKKGKTANGFMDGLKFVGRVQGVQRSRTRNVTSGTPETSYILSAVSGKELASKIYFNPLLLGKFGDDSLDYLQSFAKVMVDFLSNPQDVYVKPDKAIKVLLKACLGMAPTDRWAGIDENVRAEGEETPVSLTASPNGRLLVPETVWRTLRGAADSGPDRKAHDIIKGLIGRQEYETTGIARRSDEARAARGEIFPSEPSVGFYPRLVPMDGQSIPQPPDLGGKPIWSILTTYLNEPVNEMFYTLRATRRGNVLPTVVARQIPFTSYPFYRQHRNSTPYLDLPRWVISPKMVLRENFGASDSLRTNYTWLQPRDFTTQDAGQQAVENAVKYPPLADLADIERNGLNWYAKQLGSHLDTTFDNNQVGRFWSRLLADVTMDQHLKFTGSLTTNYIQEPIPIGDNLQYDGGIYHIEQIVHQGGISPDGKKTATTTFSLTNGISTASDSGLKANIYMIDEEETFGNSRVLDQEPEDRGGDRVFFGHNQDVVKRKT